MGAKSRPPVESNQILEAGCVDLNHSGEGVLRHEGFTLFAPGILPGEKARVRVNRLRNNYAEAELLELIKNSPQRIDPRCRYFGHCGGCSLQHLDYADQLSWKKSRIEAALQRIGGIFLDAAIPIGMEEPWRYRNKATIRFDMADEQPNVGFLERGSHRVVNIESCPVQHHLNELLINCLRYSAAVYLEDKSPSKRELPCREAVLRTSFSGELSLVSFLAEQKCNMNSDSCRDADALNQFVSLIENNYSGKITGISLLGPGSNPDNDRSLAGNSVMEEIIGPFRFRISPRAFFQVNSLQAKILFKRAAALAEGASTVLDLYCGTGTFTLNLAQFAQTVIGMDVDKSAIEDARYNASINGVENVEFINARAEAFPSIIGKASRPLTIFLNPPRSGCSKSLLSAVQSCAPDQIIYVSCDPGTMARDLKTFSGSGYRILSVQPVDMFPHTAHVECVALIGRS